jgi:hypothetical protein
MERERERERGRPTGTDGSDFNYRMTIDDSMCCSSSLLRFGAWLFVFVLFHGVSFMYAEFVRSDGRISGLQVCLFKFSRFIDSPCFTRRRV